MLVLSINQTAYNGVQQFVQSLPFIAILSGIGADSLLNHRKIPNSLKKGNLLIMLIIALLVLPGLLAMSRGHMDTYFSTLVGGTGGVYNSGLFETVWSGEPYLEVAHWLNGNAVQGAKVYVPMAHNIFNTYKYGDVGQIPTRLNVSSLGAFSFDQEALLREDIEILGYEEGKSYELMGDVDYVVLMSRFGLFGPGSYVNNLSRSCLESNTPVYSVMSDGAPIVRVYQTPCG